MSPSSQTKARALVAGALLFGAGCSESADRPGSPSQQGPGAAGDCVIARIGEQPVTAAHARTIQALIQPTPADDSAKRLVIDAALAHVSFGGGLGASPPHEWLASYRRLHDEAARESDGRRPIDVVLERLAQAKDKHGLEPGDCHATEGPT